MFKPHKSEIVLKLVIILEQNAQNVYEISVEQATAPQTQPPMRISASGPTLAALRDEWMLNLSNGDRSTTYRRDALRTLNTFLQSGCFTFPGQLTDTAITTWLAQRKILISASTLKNERGHLSAFCSFLVAKGIMEKSPIDAVATPRVLARRARLVPTEDQVRRLIIESNGDWRKKHRWLLYLIAASVGTRRGALLGVEWSMVHEDQHPPRIEFPASLVKNRREQLVWLTEECASWLAIARIKLGGKGLVFPMKQESEQFERDREAAGLPKRINEGGPTFSFHSLRHFAVTRMKAAELINDRERQSQAGHRTAAMTTNIYTDDSSIMLGKKILNMQPLLPQGFMPAWGRIRLQSFDRVDKSDDDVAATFSDSNATLHQHNSRTEEPPCLAERCCTALDRRGVLQHARCARPESINHHNSDIGAAGSNPVTLITLRIHPDLVELVRVQNVLIDRLLKELIHVSGGTNPVPPTTEEPRRPSPGSQSRP